MLSGTDLSPAVAITAVDGPVPEVWFDLASHSMYFNTQKGGDPSVLFQVSSSDQHVVTTALPTGLTPTVTGHIRLDSAGDVWISDDYTVVVVRTGGQVTEHSFPVESAATDPTQGTWISAIAPAGSTIAVARNDEQVLQLLAPDFSSRGSIAVSQSDAGPSDLSVGATRVRLVHARRAGGDVVDRASSGGRPAGTTDDPSALLRSSFGPTDLLHVSMAKLRSPFLAK
jgi:ligand-binding sensor domain-containing protein